MVLVVVLLQSVEEPSLAVGGIDVMQGVMCQIVAKITYPESYPEKGKNYWIGYRYYLHYQREEQVKLDYHQYRRMHESLSE